jgi:DnaJ-class molecular chaperone
MGIEHFCPTCFGQGVISSIDIIPGGTCPTCGGKGFITDHQFKEIQGKKRDDGDEKLEDSREGSS